MQHQINKFASRGKGRAMRGFREAFYNFGYNRDFPGKQRVESALSAWEARDGRGDVPKDQDAWDDQYADGGWEFLDGIGEVPHYAVVVGYAHFLKPNASVLDVGCGHGVLHDRYAPVGYSRYVGIDMSRVAIDELRARVSGNVEFDAADAETYTPNEKFDAIIFNESITYFTEPEATYQRYLQFLEPGGLVIVSCHQQSARARAIQNALASARPVKADSMVSSGSNSWRVVVFEGD